MARKVVDIPSQLITITNFTESISLNCDGEAGATALADVVATIVQELTRQGILRSAIS